jgi:small subunit ribosomal protein S19
MAKKEFVFRGMSLDELRKLTIKEFAEFIPSRQRRSLLRGLTEQQKIFLADVRKNKKTLETHCRDMIILPEMVEKTIKVHNGREFVPVIILPEMIGCRLGEFSMTRRKVGHHAPGIGATRSSASMSVK